MCITQANGKWPARYRIEKESKIRESSLDPNHTHFILVDDGTQHNFGVEIPFRAELEQTVSNIKTDTGRGKHYPTNDRIVLHVM